jgi:uncharacterized protein
MTQKSKQRIRKWAIGLAATYVAGGILFYLLQELFFFHGQPVSANHRYSFAEPFTEYNQAGKEGNLNFISFQTKAPKKGTVLFFHGNMKNVEYYKQYPDFFLSKGYEVWMIDYPGFGKTTGTRSEERMKEDALSFYDFVAKASNSDNMVLYGKSMGTGVASFVASWRKCRQLILETPYYSIDALVKSYAPVYPAALISRYHFHTGEILPQLSIPITLFHGTDDEVIPYSHAERLHQEQPLANLVTIEKGKHNNLWTTPLFQQTLDVILNQ